MIEICTQSMSHTSFHWNIEMQSFERSSIWSFSCAKTHGWSHRWGFYCRLQCNIVIPTGQGLKSGFWIWGHHRQPHACIHFQYPEHLAFYFIFEIVEDFRDSENCGEMLEIFKTRKNLLDFITRIPHRIWLKMKRHLFMLLSVALLELVWKDLGLEL